VKKETKSKVRNPKHAAATDLTIKDLENLRVLNRAFSADDIVAAGQKRGLVGKKAIDINLLMQLLVQLGPILGPLLIQILTKPPQPQPTPAPTPSPSPIPPPPPPAPTPTPIPTPTPVPPPVPSRTVASIGSRVLGIEGWDPRRGHFLLGGGTVRNIVNGAELIGAGYRIHFDSTPKDQNGQPFFNGDLPRYPELFAIDPTQVAIDPRNGKWSSGEGNNRIEHWIRVDGREYGPQGDTEPGTPFDGQEVVALTSEYDDGACTPVLTVPQDIDLSAEHTVAYRAVWVGPDGRRVGGNWTSEMRVHAWGF
jgi:hypothetical protein